MSSMVLIDLATKEESRIFVREWNARYGESHGKCRIKMNNHDFGYYPTVEIKTGLAGFIPEDAEDRAIELADILELEY